MNLIGVVELTSGCGYFWNAVDLCVRVDPYAAMTDAQGRYEIPQVPDGKYWLTVSPRNLTVVRVERDPETGLPFRHYYGVGISRSIAVVVRRGEVATQAITVDAAMYGGHQ